MGLHDAAATGTPIYTTGKFGNAYNPNAGYLTVSGTLTATVGTIESWVAPNGSTKVRVAIGCNATASQQWIGMNTDGTARAGVGSTVISSTVNINDAAWHHLALTLDGTNAKFFVDGVLVTTVASTAQLNLIATTAIGTYGAAGTANAWSGLIDETRVSSSIRYTAAFTPPTTAFISDGSTLALYHLEADGTDSAGSVTPPSIGTISVASAAGTDTITYPAPVAGSNPVAGVSLYEGTSAGAESTTAVATNTGTGGGTFTRPSPATGSKAYIVKAYDNAATPTFSAASNEVITSAAAPTTTTFSPDATNIIYSPYNWNVNSSAAKTINAGSYLRFVAAGTGITGFTLNFDVSAVTSPNPILKYRIDNGPFTTVTLAANLPISIPSTTSWLAHSVELVVQSTSEFVTRWTPQNAAVSLTSIVVNGTASATLVASQQSAKNVLVLGDSITEAYKSLNNNTTPDGSDATVGWAYLIGRLVGAEIGTVGFGGQGWTQAGQGGVPKLGTSYTSIYSGATRSFSAPAPDVILIEMGHNDGASDNSAVTTEATTLLNSLLTATPPTTKILVLRPFSGRQATPLQAAVAAVGNTRVTYINTTGWFNSSDSSDAVHPYGYASQTSIAPKAALAVQNVLGSTYTARRFINKGGTAVAI